MDGAAREGVGGVDAHGNVLACWDERRVCEEGGDLTAKHQWSGGRGGEVFFIVGLEGWA